jgi:hypothetical protein
MAHDNQAVTYRDKNSLHENVLIRQDIIKLYFKNNNRENNRHLSFSRWKPIRQKIQNGGGGGERQMNR